MSDLKAKIDAAVLQHRKLWNVGPDEAKHLTKAMTDIAREAATKAARRIRDLEAQLEQQRSIAGEQVRLKQAMGDKLTIAIEALEEARADAENLAEQVRDFAALENEVRQETFEATKQACMARMLTPHDDIDSLTLADIEGKDE
jgi:hypothetical protein